MKVRIECVIDADSDAWAEWQGIDPADAPREISGLLTSSAADLPGMADTPAVVRWGRCARAVKRPGRLRRFEDWPTSYQPRRPRRAPDLQLRFECVIEVPAAAWAAWAQRHEDGTARQDVAEYVTSQLADLPGIAETGARFRWRIGGKTVRRPARVNEHWPTSRENEP